MKRAHNCPPVTITLHHLLHCDRFSKILTDTIAKHPNGATLAPLLHQHDSLSEHEAELLRDRENIRTLLQIETELSILIQSELGIASKPNMSNSTGGTKPNKAEQWIGKWILYRVILAAYSVGTQRQSYKHFIVVELNLK
jgi:hypothetical protein